MSRCSDNDEDSADNGYSTVFGDLTRAQEENLALKQALRDIAEISTNAIAGKNAHSTSNWLR